jgi:hypothetical protein
MMFERPISACDLPPGNIPLTHYSKEKIRFQSFFMLMTIQPFFFASASRQAGEYPFVNDGEAVFPYRLGNLYVGIGGGTSRLQWRRH